MKKNVLLFAMGILCVINHVFAQSDIFDPNDPIINYESSNPPATPPPNTLAKWIKTPRPEIYFNTDKFKSYYFNGMPFRLRFPNGYDPADPNKKYPLILFFHGMGEIAPVTDNEFHLYWGAYKFENMINAGQFDAFLLFPTTQIGDWSPNFSNVNNVLDSIQKYCNMDPDRVITMGLSLGGDGSMKYSFEFPKRSAVSIASSPGSIPTFIQQDPTPYIHVPFWISTGELDDFSPPPSVQAYVNNFRNGGGDIRWTLFPNMGHGTWNEHWNEPYLVPYWNAAHKANPLVFNQQNQVPPNTPINVKIGITPGFAQYEWQKNNVAISGANSNEIIATELGSYRVRFMRESNPNWSDWSPNPAVISQSETPPDIIPPSTPENLTVVSGSTNSINLDWNDATDNIGVTGYDVYVDGVLKYTTANSEISADNLSSGTSYTFTVNARDLAGNTSGFSNAVTGTTSPVADIIPPSTPENLYVVSGSANSINLDWNDATDNIGVTGYDVYVDGVLKYTTANSEISADNLSSGTSYTFTVTARDLAGNTSGFSNAVTGTTSPVADIIPPSTPENLSVVSGSENSINLDWNDATDNIGVTGYDVYVDGVLKYTTANSEISADNLASGTSYSFTVNARDLAGNTSGFSNDVTGITSGISGGLNYRYYEGIWNSLPDFNSLTPVKTGISPNVDLGIKNVDDNFGIVWEGYINITTPGDYTFETISDNGSMLYFNSLYSPSATALVNNDGLHDAASATGTIYIPDPGRYPISITFFEAIGGETMEVYWTGPGIERQLIPHNAFMQSNFAIANINLSAINNKGQDLNAIMMKATKGNIEIHEAYPNPFVENFNISIHSTVTTNKITAWVFDMAGRLVHDKYFGNVSAGKTILKMDVGNKQLVQGIYFVRIDVNGKPSKMIKLMKR